MRSLRAKSIGGKILLRSIAVALVPLIILAAVAVIGVRQLGSDATRRVDESRAALESESVLVTSQDQAVSVAREINLVLLERIADVRDWARNQVVIDGAAAAGAFTRDEGLTELPIEELEERFASTKNTQQAGSARSYLVTELANNESFGEIFFTDANGFNAALTNETSDFVQSDEDWWQTAWTNGINVDDIEFDESAGQFSVDIAVRIDDPRTRRRLGVMKTTLDAKFVDRIANARSTSNTDYIIALADGQLISETSTNDPNRLMSPGLQLDEGLAAALADTEGGGLVANDTVYGYTRTLNASFFDAEEGEFAGFDWVVVSSQSAESAFAPLEGLQDLRSDIAESESNLEQTILVVLLAALLLAFVMGRFMARAITDPIRTLTAAASKSAETGLPGAVTKINEEGADIESVSVDEVLITTGDELEDLANSFNSVQNTAVSLAAKQAISRRNTSEMFVNLGRRNQSLLKRQLRFIDELEKNEADPDTLDSLFKLDHLATRMRRNAESLLVLAGDRSPRRWAAPVSVQDCIQAALAEVEGYDRVSFGRIPDGRIQGNAAADAAHILAELIENALTFSPPQSQVTIMGREEVDGYALTISDEGLGMSAQDLADANERLDTVRELSEVPSQYLGLFVVGRLADRHDIGVFLQSASTGGLAARVLLPEELTESGPIDQLDQPPTSAVPTLEDHVPSDDPELAEAEAEAVALLAQAQEALARVEDAKKQKSIESDEQPVEPSAQSDGDEVDGSKTDSQALLRMPTKTPEDSAAQPFGRRAEDSSDNGATSSSDPATPADGDRQTQPVEATNSEAVDVGGFTFSRRDSKSGGDQGSHPARRADDVSAPSANSNGESGTDLDQYGFTRRTAKNGDDSPTADSGIVDEQAAPLTEEDALVTAEHSRNRWSRFQRGKEDALGAEEVSAASSNGTTDVDTKNPPTSKNESQGI